MPKIPAAPTGGRIGAINKTSDTFGRAGVRTARVVQQVGQQITNFSLDLEQRRFNAEVKAYSNNNFAKDRAKIRADILELQRNTPRDGKGFKQGAEEIINRRIEETSVNAPSDEALTAYQSRIISFKEEELLRAGQFENIKRAESFRLDRKEATDASALVNLDAPDQKFTADSIISMEDTVEAGIGDIIAPEEAEKIKDEDRRELRDSYIRGLTLQKRHEDVISLMRGTVSKKQFKELAGSHNFSPDIIPKSRKTEADIILKGMTPKEKFQTLRSAMAGLETKRARQTTATLQRKEDTQAASMAGKVIPDAEFNDILADVEKIPNMDESRKLRHVQDLFNSRSIGQAVQAIAVMDEKNRTPQNVKKVMEDKIAANKEILAKRIDHRIATAGITGADVGELKESKNQLDDVAFNLRESTTMVNQAVTMSNSLQEALVKDPVAYGAKYSDEFRESITQAKTTDPDSVKKMIEDMDSFYDQVGLDKSDRKYISNDISEAYGERLSNQPGIKAREVIQEIHDIFGIEKTRDIMDSMADRGHIKDSMVTASFYEKPDAQTKAINLLQQEGDLKQFKPSDTEITEYNKKIEEVVAPLRRATAHSDRTSSNARVANGVKKHIDLYIRSEAPQTDAEMKEALDKAKKLFIDNEHIVGEGPRSNMYVSASSGVTKEQLDDFMDYVSDAEGLELLAKTEGVEIEINKSISEAGTPEEQKRLGLTQEEVQETWKGMVDRRMRLVNSGGDYFRPTIVNPRSGQQQSIALKNGEKFKIPISKIPGLIERMEAKALELHRKKNPPGPFIQARIKARAKAREGGERVGRKLRGNIRTAIEEIQKIQVVPSGPPDPFARARSKARAKARAVDILPDIELSASARAAARRQKKEEE